MMPDSPAPTPRSGTAVSLVIPTHQRAASLSRTLRSLDRLMVPPGDSLQVVVVLDGCTDGSERVARDWGECSDHSLILLERDGVGPAAARNAGIAHGNGALIGFIDDDVVPGPGWLRAHLDAQTRHAGAIVTLGTMQLPDDERLPPWNEWEMLSLRPRYEALAKGVALPGADDLYTANAMVPRRALAALGGFDESLRRAEDVELGRRLAAAGVRFVFCPEADVTHYPHRTLRDWRSIPIAYGRAHVQMDTELTPLSGAQPGAERLRGMHPLTRAAVRLFSGHGRTAAVYCALSQGVGWLASRVGLRSVSYAAYSSVYNVLYFGSLRRETAERASDGHGAGAPDA